MAERSVAEDGGSAAAAASAVFDPSAIMPQPEDDQGYQAQQEALAASGMVPAFEFPGRDGMPPPWAAFDPSAMVFPPIPPGFGPGFFPPPPPIPPGATTHHLSPESPAAMAAAAGLPPGWADYLATADNPGEIVQAIHDLAAIQQLGPEDDSVLPRGVCREGRGWVASVRLLRKQLKGPVRHTIQQAASDRLHMTMLKNTRPHHEVLEMVRAMKRRKRPNRQPGLPPPPKQPRKQNRIRDSEEYEDLQRAAAASQPGVVDDKADPAVVAAAAAAAWPAPPGTDNGSSVLEMGPSSAGEGSSSSTGQEGGPGAGDRDTEALLAANIHQMSVLQAQQLSVLQQLMFTQQQAAAIAASAGRGEEDGVEISIPAATGGDGISSTDGSVAPAAPVAGEDHHNLGLSTTPSHPAQSSGGSTATSLRRPRQTKEQEAEPNRIIGTEAGEPGPLENGVEGKPKACQRILPKTKPKILAKAVMDCDMAVYCVTECDLWEVENILMRAEEHRFARPFTFVMLSSVEGWGGTSTEDGSELSPTNVDHFEARCPSAGGPTQWKALEDRALALNDKENVTSYVVCHGVLYGRGELPGIFYDLFKEAWIGRKESIRICGAGGNRIPMVHIVDVARTVEALYARALAEAAEMEDPFKPPAVDGEGTEGEQGGVVEEGPRHPHLDKYIMAVDDSHDTQEEVVRAVAKEILGLEPNEPIRESLVEACPSWLSLDLGMRQSELLRHPDFPWHCREGLVRRVEDVAAEFCKARKAEPIRVVVYGAPKCGKSHFAKRIAEHYNIPLVSLDSAIELSKGQAGGEAKAPATEGEKADAVRRFGIDRKQCKYRGWVLDGYPSTLDEARPLFFFDEVPIESDKKGDDEQVDDEEVAEGDSEAAQSPPVRTRPVPSRGRIPHSAIHFTVAGGEEQDRVAARRGLADDCDVLLQDLGVDVLTLDVIESTVGSPLKELMRFEALRMYIERHGRPFNFLPTEQEVSNEVRQVLAREEESRRAAEEAEVRRSSSKQAELAGQRAALDVKREAAIARWRAEVSELKKKPLREYLIEYVVPDLTEGLMELCDVDPDDPIEYIASYLEAKAAESSSESKAA
ncbi:hypothetical protein FOL46_005555 [Perkinsus olseni]|uniref:Adenylate kinase n=1 Tax=Perkinsus olseni TaxID=32597 RepID=A0A7J6LRS1_PEROL|nr:hypothetical protein FOL46_005555 [Perkinsus olseni]